LVGSFLLFRLFDIVKPWPVDALERGLHGAWGVVLDDVVAGLLAGGCMTLILIGITAG
jgi:phosphatidylglycerophosphatase A